MELNCTASEENYLKAIFHLQSEEGTVSTNALAEKLNTRAASVTDMLKKLKAKKLLHYKPYYGFSLTTEGKRIALNVIRRHRLWEYFLAEKLKFGWEEVHHVAEELEHVSSEKLIEKLDAYLGYPQFDPHGDPIPNNRGKISIAGNVSLAALPINQEVVLMNVADQSELLLNELAEKNITLGTALQIKKRSVFDGSLQVRLKNKNIVITELLAKKLFVKRT